MALLLKNVEVKNRPVPCGQGAYQAVYYLYLYIIRWWLLLLGYVFVQGLGGKFHLFVEAVQCRIDHYSREPRPE